MIVRLGVFLVECIATIKNYQDLVFTLGCIAAGKYVVKDKNNILYFILMNYMHEFNFYSHKKLTNSISNV